MFCPLNFIHIGPSTCEPVSPIPERLPRSVHGYAIARRIEQISADQLAINQGTLYPSLLKLQQHGWIATKWGVSSTGRRVKFYSITRGGERQLGTEEADWQRAASIVTKFFTLSKALT